MTMTTAIMVCTNTRSSSPRDAIHASYAPFIVAPSWPRLRGHRHRQPLQLERPHRIASVTAREIDHERAADDQRRAGRVLVALQNEGGRDHERVEWWCRQLEEAVAHVLGHMQLVAVRAVDIGH